MTRKLLIVDDDTSVRDSLRFLLERRGYIVTAAEHGAKALTLAAAQPVDAALVDVHMPGMNGIAVCRALHTQAAETGRAISVWMMSGARTLETVKAAAEAGALEILPKPFDYPDVFRRLEVLFGDHLLETAVKPAPGRPSN